MSMLPLVLSAIMLGPLLPHGNPLRPTLQGFKEQRSQPLPVETMMPFRAVLQEPRGRQSI